MGGDTRRQFLQSAAGVGLTGTVVFALGAAAGDDKDGGKKKDNKKGDKKGSDNQKAEEVSAPEDLMREHGLLNRILLIYEEGLRRIRANEEVNPQVFHQTAELVRTFVEDYHERLEERFIFPEFERRNRQGDLVRILRRQHEAGRAVTDVILRNAVADQFRRPERRQEVVQACTSFIRMYRPHEAREDTVLFPELHKILPAQQIRELGERFEQEEDRLFGQEGFERNVERVAVIERQLGIFELDQFTPRPSSNP